MIGADHPDAIHWYAIHTKAKQELRANCNLEAWGVGTFAPCIKQRRYNLLKAVSYQAYAEVEELQIRKVG